ncbi:MAG: tetratricopeptide repeat protein [Betaproteobacteria bacterium]|nr:tetratricopeptide repeat protein [Betaproteobacteria bacterium]
MHELPMALHQKIRELSAEGDALAAKKQFEQAIEIYNIAWGLVPEPKNDWEASTWLLTAIGDACFFGGFFTSGSEAFSYALHCPGGFGNPFVHLRLGQCEFECENLDMSAEHLTRAYSLEGKAILEAENPKYFEFLKTRIKPPVSGKW